MILHYMGMNCDGDNEDIGKMGKTFQTVSLIACVAVYRVIGHFS